MSILPYQRLVEIALDWARSDPEPVMANMLRSWIGKGDEQRLVECFATPLAFGTAGLRGVVGPGPAHMNLAMIRRVTRALVEWLQQSGLAERPIIVGYDARLDSARFAAETAAVVRAAGMNAVEFAGHVPTPLVAYAALARQAAAGVMVTASHNPPEYNGYKVYSESAIQIVSPADLQIAEVMQKLPPATGIPAPRNATGSSSSALGSECVDAYIEAVLRERPPPHKFALRIAYTPLHGVGWNVLARLFAAAEYNDVRPVPSQVEPDGHFPTVRFPNPEEPGTLDIGVAFAQAQSAHILLANDPDADRLAIALPDAMGCWHLLSGNQLGLLLTDYLLEHSAGSAQLLQPLVVTTLVSTPMVDAIANVHGARVERTLTGFKWLWTAARELIDAGALRFAVAWEEALGYSTHTNVRDKDGIAAALIAADWAAQCHAAGLLPWERLGHLFRLHGAWASRQANVHLAAADGAHAMHVALERLGNYPPTVIDGEEVSRFEDLRYGAELRPAWRGTAELFALHLCSESRVLVRPSGTEPKLKLYINVPADVPAAADPFAVLNQAEQRAQRLAEQVIKLLGLVS